jgi:hypothetical protein
MWEEKGRSGPGGAVGGVGLAWVDTVRLSTEAVREAEDATRDGRVASLRSSGRCHE